MPKHSYPTKKEVLNILLKEIPKQNKMEKYILIVEHKKINDSLGIIKAEILKNGKTILVGSMTSLPQKSEESFNWDILQAGESFFDGFSADFGKETLGSMIKEGLKNSIKSGKIPFFQ